MRFTTTSILALVAAVNSQTFTDCDPTKKSCPKDVGLPASSFESDFKTGKDAMKSWSMADGTTLNYGANGAEFSIANKNQAPTIETNFNVFFGRIDVKMKAAKGAGIVSSIVMESADLDEIDWEFIGSDNGQVQSNFFGKGNTTTYDRVVYVPVTTPTDLFHTYSLDWTAERLQFLIDGVLVRTVEYSDPKAMYGKNYPQTPSKLKLGNWCGGCGDNQGTIDWAGGKANFAQGPFVMTVDSVSIKNYNPADAYEWTDRSGSWESIKIINDGSASQPTGGSNGGSSATGTETMAPTASHSVGEIHISNTPSATISGMSYSMNSASVSAQNSGRPTAGYGSGNGSSSGGSGHGSGGGAHGGAHGGSDEDCSTTKGSSDSSATMGSPNGHGSGSGGYGSAASTMTSLTVVDPTGGAATTQAPGSGAPYPTGGATGAGGANGTVSSPAEPSGPAQQTGNAAASLSVATGGSLIGVVFGLLFL